MTREIWKYSENCKIDLNMLAYQIFHIYCQYSKIFGQIWLAWSDMYFFENNISRFTLFGIIYKQSGKPGAEEISNQQHLVCNYVHACKFSRLHIFTPARCLLFWTVIHLDPSRLSSVVLCNDWLFYPVVVVHWQHCKDYFLCLYWTDFDFCV